MFATADSETSARLVATAPTGYSEDPALHAKAWEGLHISAVFERAGEFDLIHNSFDFLPLTYSGLVDTPIVSFPLSPWTTILPVTLAVGKLPTTALFRVTMICERSFTD